MKPWGIVVITVLAIGAAFAGIYNGHKGLRLYEAERDRQMGALFDMGHACAMNGGFDLEACRRWASCDKVPPPANVCIPSGLKR